MRHWFFLLCACRPDLGAPASFIAGPRVLAVQAEPPEAAPNAVVTYRVLAVQPERTDLHWAFCNSPKPLVENNVVGADCLRDAVKPLSSVGMTAQAVTPADACLLYGPDTPPQPMGQPPFRARDADVTGGYYQPIRVEGVSEQAAIGLLRIQCNLANAAQEVVSEYRTRYVANRNPKLTQVVVLAQDGDRATLQAEWSDESSETFVVYDTATQTLVERSETLRVSWFSTSGPMERDHTGAEDSTNSVTTPAQVWVVLRDDRGGVDWKSITLP